MNDFVRRFIKVRAFELECGEKVYLRQPSGALGLALNAKYAVSEGEPAKNFDPEDLFQVVANVLVTDIGDPLISFDEAKDLPLSVVNEIAQLALKMAGLGKVEGQPEGDALPKS